MDGIAPQPEDAELAALEREIAQARRLLSRLEGLVAQDLREGFAARHTRGLVAEYRIGLRTLLDRRDEMLSRRTLPPPEQAPRPPSAGA